MNLYDIQYKTTNGTNGKMPGMAEFRLAAIIKTMHKPTCNCMTTSNEPSKHPKAT